MGVNRKNKLSLIFQLIFWGLLFLLTNWVFGIQSNDTLQDLIRSLVVVSIFACISYLNFIVLTPSFLIKRKYFLFTVIILLILIIVPFVLVHFDLFLLLHERHGSTIHNSHISASRFNPIRPKFTIGLLVTSIFIFVSTIISLMIDYINNEKQKILSENERLLVEARYIRTQLNPHFFLNALNNLNSIVRLAPKHAQRYIDTLADMMRYITYDCKKNKIVIEKEISYIRNYIYLQQIKDHSISVHFNVDIQNKQVLIEPMLLMPFIENAFKYGIFFSDDVYPIKISIYERENRIIFQCENSINYDVKNNNDPSYSGLGIVNVKKRLNVNYRGKHSLQIIDDGITYAVNLSIWS